MSATIDRQTIEPWHTGQRRRPRTIQLIAHDAPFLDATFDWLSKLLGVYFERNRASDPVWNRPIPGSERNNESHIDQNGIISRHAAHEDRATIRQATAIARTPSDHQNRSAIPTIEYSPTRRLQKSLWIPQQRYTPTTPPPLTSNDLVSTNDRSLTFDLFAAIRFWLTDAAHADAPECAYDRHDRLAADHTIFARQNLPPIPIVNHYVAAFQTAIEQTLGIRTQSLWPAGKKACVILTHDVDAPLDPNTAATRRHIEGLRKSSRLSRFRSALRNAVQPATFRTAGERDRHWLFDEIIDAESQHGFRSTFFFAPRHVGMPGANAPYDVRYDIAARPFRRVFSTLADRGFETALHVSYNAHQNHAMFAEEIERLERYAATPVRGLRHHYWHLGRPAWPTLAAHARAGLEYDASLAFNEAPGFRFGVALPFHPFNPISETVVSALQIPTMLMDGAIFYRPGATAADGIATADAWIDRLVEAGGCGAIDWHLRTSYPANRQFAEWGRAYIGILDALARRHDVHVTSCTGLLDHLRDRHAR